VGLGSRVREWLDEGPLSARLGTLGLLLAALSLVLPWYIVDVAIAGGHDPLMEYTLTEMVRHNRDGTTTTFPFDVPACGCPAVARAFALAQLTAWTGAVLAAGAFWARNARARLPPQAGLALTAAAGLLLAAGPVLLALSSPSAFLADNDRVSNIVPLGRWGSGFMGGLVENAAQTTAWGPGLGWFAGLFAAALTLAAISRPRGPAPAQAEPSAAPQPAPSARAAAPPAAPMPGDASARENGFVPPPG
jgi:hypothetical protein